MNGLYQRLTSLRIFETSSSQRQPHSLNFRLNSMPTFSYRLTSRRLWTTVISLSCSTRFLTQFVSYHCALFNSIMNCLTHSADGSWCSLHNLCDSHLLHLITENKNTSRFQRSTGWQHDHSFLIGASEILY